MTEDQRKRVIDIYGPGYKPVDIPTIIRNRERAIETKVEEGRQDEAERKESECCGARMVNGGTQCEACGSDGKIK